MSTNEIKEQVIAKIKSIIENEKFKLDAYFLCGCPSDAPNQELKKACEKYIEASDAGKAGNADVEELVAALEASLKKDQVVAEVKSITSSNTAVQFVLDNKDALLN